MEANRFSAMSSQAVPSRPTLEFFPTAEGYYDYVGKKYVYQYKDHLGNVRLSYAKNPATQVLEIIEENNYYPFGLKHKGYNDYADNSNKYKYNGKELQDELQLNVYDYGARNYDAALGRWMNMDPHSENYYSLSPYNSFVNNPISFIDPTGEDILFWQMNQKTGKFEQVAFNKLDKNIQKGIEAFGKTKLGYSFLASFAKKNDKIGSLSFNKDGKYSNHYMYFQEVEGDLDFEGKTLSPSISKENMIFTIQLNKDIENPSIINEAETTGHEVFLHLLQDLDDLVSAFNKGGRGEADMVNTQQFMDNKGGYKDHRAVKEDKQGRAKKYFEYISQLKTVLNPSEVQKLVNKEVKKTYKVGVEDTPPRKKK
ncbi:RHS repeat domain-containing protein [Flavobacterium collinsii]|nr:RHS repeat-associated core domain-containing protein [Flavobacterium collinsii]